MHIYKLPLSLTAHTLFHSVYEDTHTHKHTQTEEDTVSSNFFPETEQITKRQNETVCGKHYRKL